MSGSSAAQIPKPLPPPWRRQRAEPALQCNRKWHGRARTRHPEWPSVPGQAYETLSGATSELVRPVVRSRQAGTVADLEGTLMSLHMAVLAARPWTA